MEWLSNILTSEAFLGNIPAIILLIAVIVILGKLLHVRVHTSHITIGGENRNAYYERAIVREQTKAAHEFIKALELKISSMITEGSEYGGYKTKYILEIIYDETVDWITFNHMENSEAYLECKYTEIDNILYQQCPLPQFRTPEFRERVHRWTKELIEQCLKVRELYQKQMKEYK